MAPLPFTARFSLKRTRNGSIYTFFCGLTGKPVYESAPIPEGDKGHAESVAKTQARPQFNRCAKCGKWVCDEAYDIDSMQCLSCAPLKEGHTPNGRGRNG